MIGRKKKESLRYLKERLYARIQGWKCQFTTASGREIPIKTVAQPIPIYCMGALLIPTTLAEALERMLNSFWRGSKREGGGGINWMRCERLCMRKESGGVGFLALQQLNLVMFGKHGWKFISTPNVFISRMFKAKYSPKKDFFSAKLGYRSIHVLQSIFAGQSVVKAGCGRRVGDGRTINVGTDPWLRDEHNCYVETIPRLQLNDLTVHDLLVSGLSTWDEHFLNASLCERDIQVLLNMPPPTDGDEDAWVWKHEKRGIYSVRSAYRVAMADHPSSTILHEDGEWLTVWRLQIAPKMKQMLWRFLKGAVATGCNLRDSGVDLEVQCGSCSTHEESAEHLFFECLLVQDCWQVCGLGPWVSQLDGFGVDLRRWIFAMVESGAEFRIQQATAVLWGIWRERNERVFTRQSSSAEDVVRRCLEELDEWRTAQTPLPAANASMQTECMKWHPLPPATRSGQMQL